MLIYKERNLQMERKVLDEGEFILLCLDKKVKFNSLIREYNISEDIFEKYFFKKYNEEYIKLYSFYQPLSFEFVMKYINDFNSSIIFENLFEMSKFTSEQIYAIFSKMKTLKYLSDTVYGILYKYQKLSCEFLNNTKFNHIMTNNLQYIIKNNKIDEQFFEENMFCFSPEQIFMTLKLNKFSEEFIRKNLYHFSCLEKEYIIKYQNISQELFNELVDHI